MCREHVQRPPACHDAVRGSVNRRDAKNPIDLKIQGHREHDSGRQHGGTHHHDARHQHRSVLVTPRVDCVDLLPRLRSFGEENRQAESKAEVEGENNPMLAAAQQRADADLCNRGRERIPGSSIRASGPLPISTTVVRTNSGWPAGGNINITHVTKQLVAGAPPS
jgi:hypothetical protein